MRIEFRLALAAGAAWLAFRADFARGPFAVSRDILTARARRKALFAGGVTFLVLTVAGR